MAVCRRRRLTFAWCLLVLECSPVRMRTRTRTRTAPTAAAGPPRRRGRWLMEWITRSSLPVMKVAGTGSGLASSNVRGLEGLGTGGGGTGGTTGLSDSVRRTVDEPDTRNALAGKTCPSAWSAWPAFRPCRRRYCRSHRRRGMPADLLERVQLAVVVLDGMDVVVRAPGQEDGRDDAQHHDDNDEPTDQHRPLFNRISGAREHGASKPPSGKAWRRRPRAASKGSLRKPVGAGSPRGCRLVGGCSGPASRGSGRSRPSRPRRPGRPTPDRARRSRRSSCRRGT